MTDNRDRLIDKIKKLRAKGENHAATEAEAEAFLEAAARLMAENALSDDDIGLHGIDIERFEAAGAHPSNGRAHPAAICCLSQISQLTGTSIAVEVQPTKIDGKWRDVTYLAISGQKADREIAAYMYDQCRNLIDAAWKQEKKRRLDVMRAKVIDAVGIEAAGKYIVARGAADLCAMFKVSTGRRESRSFGIGMAIRLSDKIKGMASRHRDSEKAEAVIKSRMNFDKRRDRKLDIDPTAYFAGDKVGADADLGQGVATAGARPLALSHKGE